MTRLCGKTVSCPLLIILLGVHGTAVQAEVYDISELQQPDTSSPAMAGFYSVTPDGETAPVDPVESGFATSASSDFDPERSREEESESDTSGQVSGKASSDKKKGQNKGIVRLRIKRKRPERNLADQFQCERHGFYYTNDGRCILPAYNHYLPISPQPSPGQGTLWWSSESLLPCLPGK